MEKDSFDHFTPEAIVQELDRFIIGQQAAKCAVAIALRNRWRRLQLPVAWQRDITPKNILMIGPTGVGKTEIARRLARLSAAPFVKVEASKFTEVGYVGRDVDSIIRDLAEVAYQLAETQAKARVHAQAVAQAEEKLLDILLPRPKNISFDVSADQPPDNTREKFRQKLRQGQLDAREIDIDLPEIGEMQVFAPPGLEEMTQQFEKLFQSFQQQRQKKQRLTIAKAWPLLIDQEAKQLLNTVEVKSAAVQLAEEKGIVFIDEIDKIARSRQQQMGADISGEGVQRDLLPLIEGSRVTTKYGAINTDHILFITSGAFHVSKPSDLIPELQGRLPIRVELNALQSADFIRILQEPEHSLLKQYQALLQVEKVQLTFSDDGIARMAEVAFTMNQRLENIGARRLHTVVEKVLEEVSFLASHYANQTVIIDAAFVDRRLQPVLGDENLQHYIL